MAATHKNLMLRAVREAKKLLLPEQLSIFEGDQL